MRTYLRQCVPFLLVFSIPLCLAVMDAVTKRDTASILFAIFVPLVYAVYFPALYYFAKPRKA